MTSTLIYYFILGYVFAASVDASEVSECYSVNSENYCFYTSDSELSLNDAREFCESRNSTLPIITDEVIDIVFQRFIVEDSFNVTRNRSVWIDAQARHIDNSTSWRWIDGRQSGLTSTDFQNNEDHHYWSAASVDTFNGSAVLYQSSWNSNHDYVCQFDSQQSSSATTVDQCSPLWIVHQNQGALGAWKYRGATTQQQCLGSCETFTSCKAVEWSSLLGCWIHETDKYRGRSSRQGVTQFELIRGCETSGANCQDAFRLNSTCYKVYKNERVPWWTAVNRCQSYNASLAVFSDDVRQSFPTTVLSERAWIGLMKTRWHWPSTGGTEVMYNKFDMNTSFPRDSDSDYRCAVAMATGQWKISRCADRHLVVCQSDHLLPVSPPELTTATTSTMMSKVSPESTATATATTSAMMSKGDGFVLNLSIGLAVGLTVAIVVIVVCLVVVVVKRRRARSGHRQQTDEDKSSAVEMNGQIRDDSVTYAVFEKHSQPVNGIDDQCYANVPTSSDNDAVIYSELYRPDANSRVVAPRDEQYANI